MPSLRFRSKLILTMLLVVVGATTAMLVVTRNRVQSAYAKLFSDQFQSQISFFAERQQDRLESLAEICGEVAASPTFLQALTSEDPNSAPAIAEKEVRARARKELIAKASSMGEIKEWQLTLLEDLSAVASAAVGKKGSGEARGPLRRMLDPDMRVIVLDAKGRELRRNPLVDRTKKPNAQLKEDLLVKLMRSKKARTLTVRQTGFAVLGNGAETDDERAMLTEFVLVPILAQGIKPSDADETTPPLGALLVAVPLKDMDVVARSVIGEHSELGELESGLWIGGRIYGKSIPAEMNEILADKISAQMKEGNESEGYVTLNVGGVPHRAFYKELNHDSPLGVACQVGLFSMEEAAKEQAELFRDILTSGALGLAGALLAILFVSRGLTGPIHNLVRGTNEIREGNYDVQVPVKSGDEIGQLSASFNEMAQGLALNRKYRTVLTQVADKSIARALMRGEVTLGGELRTVSVLFCDIRGFTAMTENMPPQDVILLLNEHMTAMTEMVHRHHGVVDKFVGDLIMAIFGAPVSHPEDTQNAAKCALDMLRVREVLNQSSRFKLSVGIGLATGQALAGCMGSVNRLDYTVLGERVNLASRLCDTADRGEILIDETTRQGLGEQALTELVENLSLKGFSAEIQAWRLKGYSPLA